MIRVWLRRMFVAVALLAAALPAAAQSQAMNGSIEGTVRDNSGAILPGVTVTLTNTDTGAQRVVVTNEEGVSRATLLPLGTFQVKADLQEFKYF